MRSLRCAALAALLTLAPGLGQADPSPISAEIAAKGIAATEARLAALSDPAPPELFALAGLRFLSGVEGALQLRWQTGLKADWSELPILRLPIPENPSPRPFASDDIGMLLADLAADMEAARGTLEVLGTRDFALEIAIPDLWFDINANGARDPGEELAAVAGLALGSGRMASVDVIAPTIRFDTADAAWLTAYTHLLGAFAEVGLAYDFAPAVTRVSTAAAEMAALHGTTPPNNAMDMMFGRQVDRAAIILFAMGEKPDSARSQAAHDHLLSMIRENRRFWDLVARETDNASEWVPNEHQTSGLGIVMPQGTTERWLAVLDDGEKILKGELLVPHWRMGGEAGIDLAKLFADPPALDLIGMIQGEALLPYARKGSQASAQSWRDFERLVAGDAVLFAIFFN